MPAIQDSYSINVCNRYDLCFDEDDDSQEVENIDPHEQLRKLEEEQERERIEKKQMKLQQAAKKNVKKNPSRKDKEVSSKKDMETVRQERAPQRSDFRNRRQPSGNGRPGAGSNDERYPPRRRNFQNRGQPREGSEGERRFDRPTYYKNENRIAQDGAAEGEGRPERSERYRGNRGGYRGNRVGGYRGYRNDGRDDRGKREFERRSGNDKSGVRASDKREGAGSRNWGTPGNEMDEVTDALDGAFVGQDAEPVSKPDPEVTQEAEAKVEEPEEPEPVEMTLDEWKASQVQKKQEFNIRKPNEGEKQEWDNLKKLTKKPIQLGGEGVDDDDHFDNRRQYKTHVDLDIQFAEQYKPRGRGRGLRTGGGRGRGGRGRRGFNPSNRYSNRTPPIPDVQNELEFPTLSAA